MSRPSRAFQRCVAILVATALLLGISLLTRPINHDEGQYVGAIALMRSGLPYRDFAYLQTPLQPLLLAPLSFLPAGWLLVGARVANALFGWLSLALLLLGLRGRTPPWAAATAVVALACTDVFLFGCSVARNDALPVLLLSAVVALVLRTPALGKWGYLTAGLLLGLATSAKISYALPAAGAGLFLLLQWRRSGWRPILWFAVGGMTGLLPTTTLAILAPDQFYFAVFTYSLEAPRQWWSSVGHAELLTPLGKLHDLVKYSLNGGILPGILAGALDRRRVPRLLLLDCMIVGGLIAAYLPNPAFRQYLVPVLPPLFARLAIALGQLQGRFRVVVLCCLGAFSIAGLSTTAADLRKSGRNGLELVRAVGIASAVAEQARGGIVATLAPELVAGSNVHLDRRFVTGPFLFRTEGALAGDALRLGYSPNWQSVQLLRTNSPSAIVVGTEAEPRPPLHPHGLDWYLDQWARARNYSEHKLAGGVSLFLAPNLADLTGTLTHPQVGRTSAVTPGIDRRHARRRRLAHRPTEAASARNSAGRSRLASCSPRRTPAASKSVP